MQPVVDLTCPLLDQLYDILIIILPAIIMIQFRNFIEQSMLMRYYRFYEQNCVSLQQEWRIHFKELIQIMYATIDNYIPRDCSMSNEGKDSGYADGYNQGLLAGHNNGWDEAKEYY